MTRMIRSRRFSHSTRYSRPDVFVRLACMPLEDRTTPTTFTVNSAADSGVGTLRNQIALANANPGPDTINFDPAVFSTPQTITLTSGQITVSDSTTIIGPGSALLTVSGNNASRIFNLALASGVYNLSGMTITGGSVTDIGGGISIADSAIVNLDSMVVTGNKATGKVGGGISARSNGFLTINNSTISGNTAATGGGIYFGYNGSLLLENSTISGNTATSTTLGGGGFYFYGTADPTPPAGFTADNLVVLNSTISGNTSACSGGGFLLNYFTGTLLVQNSTISGNSAALTTSTYGGGGVAILGSNPGTLSVVSSIISGNTNSKGPAILSAGTVNVNFSALDSTTGFTLSGTSANNLTTANSTVAALGLGTLANNGGLTNTIALSSTSTAINAGSNPANLTNDQRGAPFVRAFGQTDIGAYEAQPPGVTINQAATQADPTNKSPIVFNVVFTQTVNGFDGSDIVFTGSTAPGTLTATVTGTGPSYTVTVSGMTGSGTVVASIPANAATGVSGGLGNLASSSTDNTVTYDVTPPTATLASVAPDPTNAAIPVTVTFSEPVNGFTASDLVPTNGTISNFAGSGSSYTFTLTPTGQGISSVLLPAGTVTDLVGNASTVDSNTISRTFDNVAPTVTIDQAAGQADPTPTASVLFTVMFSEAVTGFTGAGVTLSGTAGATTAVVTGSGTTYTVTVSGMTLAGTVIATIPAGGASDAAGNGNVASTSTDNTVTYAPPNPTVTVEQAVGQGDPTNQTTVFFTATFNQAVNGFDASDVVLGGTAKPTTVVISGTGPIYTLAVSGMSAQGTITASIPANSVTSVSNNLPNPASTSVDNVITYDSIAPTFTLASTAPAFTNVSPIPVTVMLTEPVASFTAASLTLVNATVTNFAGSGKSYTFDLVPTGQGTVSVSVAAGITADPAGNPNTASNLLSRTFDNIPPVPTITLGPGIIDPTNASPIVFAVTFSEPVTGFDKLDVTLGGTAKAKTATVTGSGADYLVSVSGMANAGTVTVSIRAAAATDPTGNESPAAGPISIGFDADAPTVTVGLAAGQTNHTNVGPVKFLLTFSEPVLAPLASALSTSLSTVNPGLALSVSALTTAVYEVVVTNVHGTGNVVLTVPAGVTTDLAGNPSKDPTLNGNIVQFDDVPPSVVVAPVTGQTNPTLVNPMKFSVTFSEVVTGFDASDVVFGGTANPTSATVTGSGKDYVVSVGGMSRRGTVTVSVPAGAAVDGFTNASLAGSAPVQTYSPTGGGVPIGSEVQLTATGAGPGGGPHVQVYNANGTTRFSFFAYDPSFTGGVRVAVGDVNGDGTDDIITAAGPGGGPHVKVFDGVTGKELWGFFAYDPSFTGGVYVAVADFNGDGIDEIVTGAGAGGGPHVKVIDVFTGAVHSSFFAYAPTFTGGVNVATGDVTGDDVPDIITGPGAGGGAEVHVYNSDTGTLLHSFVAGVGGAASGLVVASGDFLGDSTFEIAVAPASNIGGVSNQVVVYDGTGTVLQAVDLPTGFEAANGLRLAAGTRQPTTNHAALLVAPGPGEPAKVRRFGDTNLVFLDEFAPYSASFLGGVYVA